MTLFRIAITVFAIAGLRHFSYSQNGINAFFSPALDEEIMHFMGEGDIPGLSIVLIRGDQHVIKNYGYQDLDRKVHVTDRTLFQIGSCSKAFTALAFAHLLHQKGMALEDLVSDYIPWFKVKYKDSVVNITLGQLLHHTSGLPWNTIARIPESQDNDALEMTVRTLINQELDDLPGEKYQYATINYDVLALVIEMVSNQSFESYIGENVFKRLRLDNTTIGKPYDAGWMAKGYKVGFFAPREYEAPVFAGNNAAGYVISNGKDMVTWLRLQMGTIDSELDSLIKLTHERDVTVALHDMDSYAGGWNIALDGTGKIYHGGMNPNFASYVGFLPDEHIGIAVLANSNSNYANYIGEYLIRKLSGDDFENKHDPGDGNDTVYSFLSMLMIVYILVAIGFFSVVIVDIKKGNRFYATISLEKYIRFLLSGIIIVPFLFGIYILPKAVADFTWSSIVVWTPVSFIVLVALIVFAIVISYIVFFVTTLFPDRNRYKGSVPLILVMGILSGLSNLVIIVLVTSSIGAEDISFLLFYYALALGLYLGGRRFVQTNLIRLTRGLIYDLQMRIIGKIFLTSYQRFESIDRGKVFTTLNEDVNTIGQSTYLFATLITSLITGIGAIIYLAAIAFWATILTISLIVVISALYYSVSKRATAYFEKARDEQNIFMDLISGLVDGFKEISMHGRKKNEFKNDVANSAGEYRKKISEVEIKFVNAFLVGESLLLTLLAIVSFGIPKIFPSIEPYVVMGFVIVLLYLIGPINSILGSMPSIIRLRVAWDRIRRFTDEIPANLNSHKTIKAKFSDVQCYKAVGIQFRYKNSRELCESFMIGPVDLELRAGEILFIIGGNGSGKTTLAKILTGLYEPDSGHLEINGKIVNSSEVGECFSSVFNPLYLFKTLYGLEESNPEVILKYLKVLDLDKKVQVKRNRFSTIDLSGGQRKRLALLKCYLEDSPIYLFDELAADQDPEYRNFFYRTLLPEMKKRGKIVIAITHDDNYFDVADRIIKMNRGNMEAYEDQRLINTLV